MDIKEFLDLTIGKWFSQRASYHLDRQKAEHSKGELTIEMLSVDNSEILNLCEQHQINPHNSLGGIKTSWDNSVDWGKPKQKGSTIITVIPDVDNPQVGKLVGQNQVNAGRYILGNDEALTLIIEDGKIYSEERLWFASPNLRLRTTIFKYADGFSTTSFYSEIRKIPPKKEEAAVEVKVRRIG